MGQITEKAKLNHRSGHMCSSAVLCAFADKAGLTQEEAVEMARPFAGGRGIRCGAVLAAEKVLEHIFDEATAAKKKEELERRFTEMNQSVICAELKGRTGGKVLRSCPGCVEDAATILEEMV